MQLTEQQQKGQELVNSLVSKAWEDADFKHKLVQNPVATIEAFTGEKLNLPEGKKIAVNDFTAMNENYFIIPPQPDLDELELTDEQLEDVSGGCSPVSIGVIAVGWTIGYNIGQEVFDGKDDQ